MRPLLMAIALLSLLAAAHAQADEPPAFEPAYEMALQAVVEGRFEDALTLLGPLEPRATHPAQQSKVHVLKTLATTWRRQGLVLVKGQDLTSGDAVAKVANRRTTSELGLLYLNAVLYGVGTAGWTAVLTEPDSAAGFTLPAIGLAGLSAGGVWWLDHMGGRPMGYGVPQSIMSGMRVGLMEGIAWVSWNEARVHASDQWSGKQIATVIWGSATAGALVGGWTGARRGTTPGQAALLESGASWTGAVLGMSGAALSGDSPDDVGLLMAAIGLNVGAVGGYLLGESAQPSIARVRYLDLGGISGGLVLGGLYIAIADEDTEGRPLAAITAAGVTAGLVTAWRLTAGMSPDEGPGQPVHVSLAPTPMGGPGLSVSGLF